MMISGFAPVIPILQLNWYLRGGSVPEPGPLTSRPTQSLWSLWCSRILVLATVWKAQLQPGRDGQNQSEYGPPKPHLHPIVRHTRCGYANNLLRKASTPGSQG